MFSNYASCKLTHFPSITKALSKVIKLLILQKWKSLSLIFNVKQTPVSVNIHDDDIITFII